MRYNCAQLGELRPEKTKPRRLRRAGLLLLEPEMAKLSTAQRRAMPAKEFAGGKPKGDAEGRFPLNDKAHIKAAESYERYATPAEKEKIDAAAKKAFPKRGERTATNQRTREGRHPQSHAEFERLGNED